jgi:drug/metabolite transporter (DMT)-like permease
VTDLRGPFAALGAAVLFGASTPVAKLLLGETSPLLLAGLLYTGAGLGLLCLRALRPVSAAPEVRLRRADLPTLAAVIVTGGILGPVLLMLGLSVSSGAATSLLLNLEGVFTLAVAWVVYGENVSVRIGLGAAAILVGATLLSFKADAGSVNLGGLAVAGACLCWALDNNLTRNLSASDPIELAMIKGLVAGPVNLLLAFATGTSVPTLGLVGAAGAVGFLGYGVSLALFVVALRHVGTARTGAYFSVGPFLGAALAVPLLGESVTWQLAAAAILMGIGLWIHLTEHHEHEHVHERIIHEHPHVHDLHHQHAHAPGDAAVEPHTHEHEHARLVHSHPHLPDIHHRHRHGGVGQDD